MRLCFYYSRNVLPTGGRIAPSLVDSFVGQLRSNYRWYRIDASAGCRGLRSISSDWPAGYAPNHRTFLSLWWLLLWLWLQNVLLYIWEWLYGLAEHVRYSSRSLPSSPSLSSSSSSLLNLKCPKCLVFITHIAQTQSHWHTKTQSSAYRTEYQNGICVPQYYRVSKGLRIPHTSKRAGRDAVVLLCRHEIVIEVSGAFAAVSSSRFGIVLVRSSAEYYVLYGAFSFSRAVGVTNNGYYYLVHLYIIYYTIHYWTMCRSGYHLDSIIIVFVERPTPLIDRIWSN